MTEINENIPIRSVVSWQAAEAIDLANRAFSISIMKENLKQFTWKRWDTFMGQRVKIFSWCCF